MKIAIGRFGWIPSSAQAGPPATRVNSCSPSHKPGASPINERKNTSTADMNKQITRVWSFASDSNPSRQYETLEYSDGSKSCNCAGWTRRVAADGTRSCKHTRAVDMGTADQTCKATHSYESNNNHQLRNHQQHPSNAKNGIFQIPKLGHRKFAV